MFALNVRGEHKVRPYEKRLLIANWYENLPHRPWRIPLHLLRRKKRKGVGFIGQPLVSDLVAGVGFEPTTFGL